MNDIDPVTRALLIDIRSLLLKAVDLIERRLVIGKYKTNMVEISERDSVTPKIVYNTEN